MLREGDELADPDSDEPLLRLITCGGDYDRAHGGYQHNVVVYASMAPN